jgi:hypothetical protein
MLGSWVEYIFGTDGSVEGPSPLNLNPVEPLEAWLLVEEKEDELACRSIGAEEDENEEEEQQQQLQRDGRDPPAPAQW